MTVVMDESDIAWSTDAERGNVEKKGWSFIVDGECANQKTIVSYSFKEISWYFDFIAFWYVEYWIPMFDSCLIHRVLPLNLRDLGCLCQELYKDWSVSTDRIEVPQPDMQILRIKHQDYGEIVK